MTSERCWLGLGVAGAGFFDFIHGQSGVAPQRIELHPILAINVLRCASSNPTLPPPPPPPPGGGGSRCDRPYPTVCLHPPPPDLGCGDVPYRNFEVEPPDDMRFDGNHDGVGCET